MRVVVCPGQGSQRFGMLDAFVNPIGAGVLPVLTLANIDDTAVAQPLIVSASLSSYRDYCHRNQVSNDAAAQKPDLVAGHSVGMLAAFAVAGCYGFETAVKIALERGRLFHDAATNSETGMSALIGKNVFAEFLELNASLDIAVVNSDSQIVVAGLKSELNNLSAIAPKGIRVSPLKVSGAFHTKAMESARTPFADFLQNISITDPQIPTINDLTGELFSGGLHGYGSRTDVIEHLLKQITNPVRWDLVTQQLRKQLMPDAAAKIIELAPSGTLTALLKRALPGIEISGL